MKIKVCGITNAENAKDIACLNVDFLGLIFTKSPRKVNLEEAKNLSQIIKTYQKKVVGIFTNEDDSFILENAKYANLDGVQIYKRISKELFEFLREQNLFVWQVVSVGENLKLPKRNYADMILFDAKGENKGGNGVNFDWNLLQNLEQEFAIAGGIGLYNIKEVLKLKPSVIDINSKVEVAPGLKDIDKIKQIVKEIKG